MDRVLFVCTHNSSRSQMAEGLLNHRYGGRYEARSAGTDPSGVNPFAAAVMKEIGIDISDHTSDPVDAYDNTPLDIVVTVCDDAAENCPYIPARKKHLHQSFDDPSAVIGTDDEKRAAFRRVRDALAEWIDATFGRATFSGPDSEAPGEEGPRGEEVAIQTAGDDDLPEIQFLLQANDLPHEDLTPSHMSDFLVCRTGDTLCGVVGMEDFGAVALLRSLAVRTAYRDKGLGTRLTNALEGRARRCGIGALYLLTTTASAYFQRRGYETIDREALPEVIQSTEEAARLCPTSATCMRKKLTGVETTP